MKPKYKYYILMESREDDVCKIDGWMPLHESYLTTLPKTSVDKMWKEGKFKKELNIDEYFIIKYKFDTFDKMTTKGSIEVIENILKGEEALIKIRSLAFKKVLEIIENDQYDYNNPFEVTHKNISNLSIEIERIVND